MIDFVGTPPVLRIALWVSMETMCFHLAQKLKTKCFVNLGSNEKYGTHVKLS